MAKVKVLVLTGYGINCDYETQYCFQVSGAQADRIHVNDLISGKVSLQDYHILTIPGGFSYADDLGAAKVLANKIKYHLKEQVEKFIQDGKLIVGICNGFQVLVKLGILPGFDLFNQESTLTFNDSGRFEDRWINLKVDGSNCIWANGIDKLSLPVRHGEGKFFANQEVIEKLFQNKQVVLQYADENFNETQNYPENPNGSLKAIAGICDKTGKIFGLMPHPEAFNHCTNHPGWTRPEIKFVSEEGDGVKLFRNAVHFVEKNLLTKETPKFLEFRSEKVEERKEKMAFSENNEKLERIKGNLQNTISNFFVPELGKFEKGKVRDNYVQGDKRVIITSDRISAFDFILKQAIPFKGQMLNQIAVHWFEQTKDIIQSHLIDVPDPNVVVVKQVKVIPIEMVVRGYITGSAWRDYSSGKREKCGIKLQDNLKKNQKFEKPILTPTTKSSEGHDLDISREEIIVQGIVPREIYEKMENASLKLFERGQELCNRQGLILVDTKYEFGLDENNNLVLVDEIHTPDSSRFWHLDSYEDLFSKEIEQKELSKEFVRKWLMDHNFSGQQGQVMPDLPEDIILETSLRYIELYEKITGKDFEIFNDQISSRILKNLYSKKYLSNKNLAVIIAGSDKDSDHVNKIIEQILKDKISCLHVVYSAHKNTREILSFLEKINRYQLNICFVTCAGRSNALSGVVACNTNFPVIACPPFSDLDAYMVDIHSSLRMPSNAPVAVIVDPKNAALFVKRIFNLKN